MEFHEQRAATQFRTAGLLMLCAFALAGCDQIKGFFSKPPDLKFAPYGDDYRSKPDFAAVEHQFPLAPADLAKLTPDNMKNYDQEQIDQIYARLTAGPIPDGSYDGGLFFPKGKSGDRRLTEIVGGLPGLAVELKSIKMEMLGAALWRGKVFYRKDMLLRNRIDDTPLLKPLIEAKPTAIQKQGEQMLLFPAQLYCGQSLLDSRRESIIIDYFFSDQLPDYHPRPDFLAARNGLQVRDEIRMVRPGFYLGRAYVSKAFLLNFTLYNAEADKRDGEEFGKTGQVKEDCWPGTQSRKIVTASQ